MVKTTVLVCVSSNSRSANYFFEIADSNKLNKAVGEEGMQAEILIADPLTAAEILHPHIAAAWKN